MLGDDNGDTAIYTSNAEFHKAHSGIPVFHRKILARIDQDVYTRESLVTLVSLLRLVVGALVAVDVLQLLDPPTPELGRECSLRTIDHKHMISNLSHIRSRTLRHSGSLFLSAIGLFQPRLRREGSSGPGTHVI